MLGQDLQARRAVDQRAFLQFVGDGLEVAHQQPRRERDEDGRIDQHQRHRRVEQAVGLDDGGERDEQDRRRHEVGQEDQAADELRAGETQADDGVGSHDAGDQRDEGRQDRHVHRVPQPQRIARLEQQLVDVLERRPDDPERVVGIHVDELFVRFDGGQHHPVEREQQHDQDQRQRQPGRHHAARQRVEVAHALGGVDQIGPGQLFREVARVSHCRCPAATCASAGRTTTP